MRSNCFVLLVACLLVATGSWAAQAPGDSEPGASDTSGDTPLTPLYEFSGKGGIDYDVEPMGTGGTFTLAGIPGGATVEKAYFITGIWDDFGQGTHSMAFTFAGNNYGNVAATTFDVDSQQILDLGGYVVDVTSDVSGNGNYAYTAVPNQPGTGIFGSLLIVVYEDLTADDVTIQINAGGESLLNANSTTSFAGVLAGTGTLHIFVEADDPGTGGEESIAFNGAVILGGMNADVFNMNQGSHTSYFELGVTTVAGANTTTLTTGDDWLGWHAAALISPGVSSPVEPTTWSKVKSLYR